MKKSKLWSQLAKERFSKIDEKFLVDFRETGKPNNRLASWDPFDETMRYYNFLLFHQLQTKDDIFFDNYEKIGNTSLGNPVELSVRSGAKINLDHFFSIEEYTFLNKYIHSEEIKNIVEIGAGFGRTAQALIKLVKGIHNYTIIDIPEVLSLSACYLEKVLTNEEYQKISFINAYTINDENCDFSSTSLVININSFQEMPKETVMYYFEKIIYHSNYFYTKNAVGKYKPELIGLHGVNEETLQDVFELGLSTDIIDIFNEVDLQEARLKHIELYRPNKSFLVIAEEPLGIFPYYHNVLYARHKIS